MVGDRIKICIDYIYVVFLFGVCVRGAGDKSTWTAPAVTFQPMGVLWTSAPHSKGLEELFLAMATCCFLLAVIQS